MFACNNFPFREFAFRTFHACVTMIYWNLTEILPNLVAPLDSAVPSLNFKEINVFWTSGFDSVNIVFDSLSVGRSLPEMDFSHSI